MLPRDDRWKAAHFAHPETIPVSAGILPAAWMRHRAALDAIVRRYPEVFGASEGDRNYDAIGRGTYVAGNHTDAWGCVWSNVRTGMEAIVTGHPLPEREMIHALCAPEKDEGLPHGYMFLRLTDLRGFEEAMIDFAEEPPELQQMIDLVLAYNVRQAERMAREAREAQWFWLGDDLGMQTGLPTGAAKWRAYLKPCFQKIWAPFKSSGHGVYVHTDGCIHEIIPDLYEAGADIINPQVRANGLENLRRVCRGRIPIALDLDRQMFPFCTPQDIDDHVREAVEMLATPAGGLWLQAEIAPDVPLANVEAIAEALLRYRRPYT